MKKEIGGAEIRRMLIFRDRSLSVFKAISGGSRSLGEISVAVARHPGRRDLTPLVNRACPHLGIRTLTRRLKPRRWTARGIGWIRKNSPESTTSLRLIIGTSLSDLYALLLPPPSFSTEISSSAFSPVSPLREVVKPRSSKEEEEGEGSEGRESFYEGGGVSRGSSSASGHPRRPQLALGTGR